MRRQWGWVAVRSVWVGGAGDSNAGSGGDHIIEDANIMASVLVQLWQPEVRVPSPQSQSWTARVPQLRNHPLIQSTNRFVVTNDNQPAVTAHQSSRTFFIIDFPICFHASSTVPHPRVCCHWFGQKWIINGRYLFAYFCKINYCKNICIRNTW